MLDTFIGVWKCVEKILEPFECKKSFFWQRHEDLGICCNFLMSSPKKWIFCIQMALKFFLRTFIHQWRYLSCSLDPKIEVDINYMLVGWIGVAYHPISSAPTKSKKSLIFRIWGCVGIFSYLHEKSWFFSSKWL